jgi:hypothetical protein
MKAQQSQFPEAEHNDHPHGSEWTPEALEAFKHDAEEEATHAKEAEMTKSYLPTNASPF